VKYRWAWVWAIVIAEFAFALWIMGAVRPLG